MSVPFGQQLEILQIPQSDEIFYFNHDVYDNYLLKNIISKENFDNILTECEKVVCKSHVKKAKFDKQELSSWIYTFGIISFIIFIIFLIILYYSPRHSNGKELSIISVVFALFGSLILIIVLIYNIFKKKIIGKDIEDFVNEDLNKYLDKIKKKFTNGINFTYNQKKKMIIFSFPKENSKIRKIKLDREDNEILNSDANLFQNIESKSISNFDNLSPNDNKNSNFNNFFSENDKIKSN